jgi:hypothetical protein
VESPAGAPGSDSQPGAAVSHGGPRDLGCFLPILVAGLGLGLGWWAAGMWVALGGWIAGGVLGLYLFARLSRGTDFTPLGCPSVVVLLLVGALIPAVGKIRRAAERIRTEHELRQQQSPPAPAGDQK